MAAPAPLSVVLTLTALIDGLFEAVCARYGVFPIRGPLVLFLWRRFSRIKLLFANLAARVAAGKELSARTSRPGRARTPRDDHGFRLARWVCPKSGWLCRIASSSVGASAFAWALRELLTTDPEMLALLAATPVTARILRPLCWMLGVAQPKPPVLSAAPRAPVVDEAARPGALATVPRTIPAPPSPPAPPGVVRPVSEIPAVFFKAA